jgi:hypothetical protein
MSCVSNEAYSQNQNAVTTGLFSFVGSVALPVVGNNLGWVALIVSAIGISVLAGVSLLGSSPTGPEGVHIMFVAGLLVVIWVIIIAAEGYPGPGELFFNSLDGLMAGAGAALFLLMNLIYAVGIVTAVSRGGV